jgi:DNA-3-methyladenine glycosylase II
VTSPTTLTLAVDGPLDPAATLARYHHWGEDPTTCVDGNTLRRVLRLGDRLVPYEVHVTGGVDDARLAITFLDGDGGSDVERAATAEVRRLYGLDFDLSGFYRMAKADPALAPLVQPLYGLRPTLAPTPLEMLVGSISAQQVNLSFAFACRARLVRRWGTPVSTAGGPLYAFPTPARLAAGRLREYRVMKFSTRKGEYIRDVARAVVDGALDLDALMTAPSTDVIAALTALRGLGRWTADWFLARCCGRGPICPAGDLAVRKAFDFHYARRGRTLSEEAIRRRARAWGEYQNLAVHYLLAGMRLHAAARGGEA